MTAATELADAGFRVFPLMPVDSNGVCTCSQRAKCTSPGKHPYARTHGFHDATDDSDEVEKFEADRPGCNIGVATGNGVAVVDIDVRDGKPGAENWAKLCAANGGEVQTSEVRTGSGGRHLYYRVRGGHKIKCMSDAGAILPGVECKGDGGYVVAPPSFNDLGPYEWIRSPPLDLVADAPQWLVDLITVRAEPAPRPTKRQRVQSALAEGSRNASMTSRAGALRRAGACEDAILTDLERYNAEHCSPPLDPAEVAKIAHSVARYSPAARPAAQADPGDAVTYGNDYASAVAICRNPDIIGGEIEFDRMLQCPTLNRAPLEDHDINALRVVISRRVSDDKGKPLHISKADIFDAVSQVAHESPYLPQAEYLMGLRWDGCPRLDLLSSEILHAKSDPELARDYARCWCVAAVARALEPGCQFDHMLILCGPEGLYKSSFFKVLCAPWFVETTIDPSNKDSHLSMTSTWVLELSELSSIVNARDREAMLSFLTMRDDVWRLSYGKLNTRVKRHSVIVGTTNRQDFISSLDGARRFWPILVGSEIDIDKLGAWRDQVWAEAVHLHRTKGEPARYLSERAQRDRAAADRAANWTEHDTWHDRLTDWTSGKAELTTLEAMQHLGLDAVQQTKQAQMRVAESLKRLGYSRVVRRVGGRTPKIWVRA
jgi:hypothetical protein